MKILVSIFLLSATAFPALTQTTDTDSVVYTLGEVIVKANPRVTSLKGDALLTRVSGTYLENAGTANDVLTQVPMVTGSEGNFEVFGKGSPAIYVNGRQLYDISELAQISSANIKNVEVITNPGAKYDASTKAVINITLKAPQGDGFSGLIRAQAAWQKYFRTSDRINLKYRTGGLEIFGNFDYFNYKGKNLNTIHMLTRSTLLWHQTMEQNDVGRASGLYGKAGFSYLFNSNHSIGAYYSNAFKNEKTTGWAYSRILTDGLPYDELLADINMKSNTGPKHHANAYYSGVIGKLNIDFNMDYMWRKSSSLLFNNESSDNFEDALVSSSTTTHSHMFAEKLVFGYPVWNGQLELGEEITSSRFNTNYITDASLLQGAESRVDEKNLAGFIQLSQQIGRWRAGAGLRYEHVNFNYLENGQRRDDMNRSYNNLFPSLSVASALGNMQMGLSYTHKTQHPSYSSLDGTIDYINRFTFEGGNPYLRPEKIHNIQLSGVWKYFFSQISYTYKKDPILNTAIPYGDNSEIKLITKVNFPKIQRLEVFAGGQFQLGIWYPKVNAGIIKQWLAIDYNGRRKALGNPMALIQFQNAIHLPADIWLNIDLQWMSAGNEENAKLSSSSYMNVKLYKAFFNNRFNISVEANDIFNKNIRNITFYNQDVTLFKSSYTTSRTLQLTLQYTFNSTRDRYRGQGSGSNEINRF